MKHIPDWSRLMSKATLARYLDITPTELEREVMQGRLPMPVKVGSHYWLVVNDNDLKFLNKIWRGEA